MPLIGVCQYSASHSQDEVDVSEVVMYQIPAWAPQHVTQVNVRYYYFPDYEAYYDLALKLFIFKGAEWTFTPSLPLAIFGNIDLYNASVVPLYFHGNLPMEYFIQHKSRYPKGYRQLEIHHKYDAIIDKGE